MMLSFFFSSYRNTSRKMKAGGGSEGARLGVQPIVQTNCSDPAILGSATTAQGVAGHTQRGVAQPGSAPALGAGSRRFKSGRPDLPTWRWPPSDARMVRLLDRVGVKTGRPASRPLPSRQGHRRVQSWSIQN